MKEYNIKAIVSNDELKLVFECDKDKNTKCNKRHCDVCNYTSDSKYMKARERIINQTHNRMITDKDVIVRLEEEIECYRNKIQQIRDNKIIIDKPNKVKSIEEVTVYAIDKQIQTIINYEYEQEDK